MAFSHIETIARCLDDRIEGMKVILKQGKDHLIAVASFNGQDTEDTEEVTESDFRERITMDLNDTIAAREALRENTGI